VADGVLTLQGAVLSPDGAGRVAGSAHGPVDDAEAIGRRLAAELLDAGARELLAGGPENGQ
jgi:hydroxymethylbilane synthase